MGSCISFTERGLFEGVSGHVYLILIKGDGAQPKMEMEMEIPTEVEKLVRE